MDLIITQVDGVIVGVRLADVVGQVSRSVPVATDPDKLTAYVAANAGKTVLQRDFEKATQQYGQRLLLVFDGAVVQYPVDTLVLPVSKIKGGATLLIDLIQTWQQGKYRIVDNSLVLAPDWVEPTMTLLAAD